MLDSSTFVALAGNSCIGALRQASTAIITNRLLNEKLISEIQTIITIFKPKKNNVL